MVLGIALLPEQDVTFQHVVEVMSVDNWAICWKRGD